MCVAVLSSDSAPLFVPTDGVAYSRFTQTALRTHVAHQHYNYYIFVLKGKFFATK